MTVPEGLTVEAARRFARFVAFSSELVITCDRRAMITFVNLSAKPLLGYEPDELIGQPWAVIVDDDDRERELAQIQSDFAGQGVALPVQTRYRTKAGEVRLFSWTGGYDAESDEMFYVARDVTADEAAKIDAERRLCTDPLTGIANRCHYAASLAAELERWQCRGPGPAVLMIDVDHFKRANDLFGHMAGDALLCAIASRLARSVRVDDVGARWGGEEFAVMLARIPNDESLYETAESIRRAFAEEPFDVAGDLAIAVTVSIGAVPATPDLQSADDLIDAADRALYAAKRGGRNQTRLLTHHRPHDLESEELEAIRIAKTIALSAIHHEGLLETHCERVADLCGHVAAALGLDQKRVLRCRLAGWLHDVGKVAVPLHILTKPAPLDSGEWTILRTHAAAGERLVRRIPRLADVASAVRSHHERWDGTGYPDGLTGSRIPIEARIVAAVDAYTAMTTSRSYRTPLPRNQALEELAHSADTHLDPAVVHALLALLNSTASAEAA